MLITLNAFGSLCGYLALDPNRQRVSRNRYAVAMGCCIGCGILVKSAGALIVPITFAVWCALRGFWRIPIGTIVRVALPAAVLPSLYFVPHMFYSYKAFRTMLFTEIINRAVVGYHHTQIDWYYWKLLFVQTQMLPPSLIVFALGVCLARWWRHRSAALLLVLCSFLVPFALYSLFRSRGDWYINTAIPPLAVMVGGSLAIAQSWMQNAIGRPGLRARLAVVSGFLVLGWSAFALAANLHKVATEVFFPLPGGQGVGALDALGEAVRGIDGMHVVSYGKFAWPQTEKPHLRRVHKDLQYIRDPRELESLLSRSDQVVVLTRSHAIEPFLAIRPLVSYLPLGAAVGRKEMWAFNFSSAVQIAGMRSPALRIETGNPNTEIPDLRLAPESVRTAVEAGRWAAFETDRLFARLPVLLRMQSAAGLCGDPPPVWIAVNGAQLANPQTSGGLQVWTIPAGTLLAGRNLLIANCAASASGGPAASPSTIDLSIAGNIR